MRDGPLIANAGGIGEFVAAAVDDDIAAAAVAWDGDCPGMRIQTEARCHLA